MTNNVKIDLKRHSQAKAPAPAAFVCPAGEFAIGMNNGGQVLLSQYSGKVILLAFLYTT